MSDTFATYRPPGVYPSEETTPLVSSVGINPSVIALVGPSVGYRTFTEAVVLNGTANTRLSKLGISGASVVVISSAGVTMDLTDDYTLTAGQGADATSSTKDDTLDIKRAGGSTIGDGEQVVVTYRYTDPTYFDPLSATNYDDVKQAFGEPFDGATGAILSPLSLAAKFAFDNGASRIVLLATPGSSTAVDVDDLNTAYASLLSRPDVNILVPLPVGINGTSGSPGDVPQVGTNLKNHVQNAEVDSVFRVAILGFEKGVTIDPAAIAGDIDHRRVMLAHPNKMSYYNAFLNQTIEVGGYYLAAAYAGRLSSLPPQYPLTRKAVRGFTGIPSSVANTMTRPVRDAWSGGGVAVTEQSASKGLWVRHGVTTDVSSVLNRELSIIRGQDAMIRAMIDSFDAAELIGSPIVAETPARIKGLATTVLETMVDSEVIVGYSGLSVRQTSLDPTVIEVKFLYAPTYPNNYIAIVFGIDTTSGALVVDASNTIDQGA